MRSLGIRTAFLDAISRQLESMPAYANREIDGYVVLCAYAKYLYCIRPPIRGFAQKFEQCFGARPNHVRAEYQALRALFDLPLSWQDILRFAMADVVGDVRGVCNALEGLSVEDSVQLVGHAIAGPQPLPETELIEMESAGSEHHQDMPRERAAEVLSEEKYLGFLSSMRCLTVRTQEFLYSGAYDEVIAELTQLFPQCVELMDTVLKTYRASEAKYRPTRVISEKLFERIRQVDALDLYDALREKTEFISTMVEVAFAYEIFASSLDRNDASMCILLVDPSIKFLTKWLDDGAFEEARTIVLFTDTMTRNYAMASSRVRARGPRITIVDMDTWANLITSAGSGRLPKVTNVYMNGVDDAPISASLWDNFNTRIKPMLADSAVIYRYCAIENDATGIGAEQQQQISGLQLMACGSISGMPIGPRHRCPCVACYSLVSNPNQKATENCCRYTAQDMGERILISLDTPCEQFVEHDISELLAVPEEDEERGSETQAPAEVKQASKVEVISFSPEISFRMRRIYRNGRFDGIDVYCNGPARPKARRSRGMKEGPKLTESTLCKYFKDETKARRWVLEEYPFLSTKHGTVKQPGKAASTIRTVIGEAYEKSVRTGLSSLRSFYYVNERAENQLSNRKKAILKELMMGSVGLLRLRECTVEALSNAMYSEDNELAAEALTERLGLIHMLLQLAVKLKCIDENQLQTWANTIKKIESRRKQSREALGKNSLSISQLQRVYRRLEKGADDPRCLGLMIQMFTGLSAREICALRLDSVDTSLKLTPATLLRIEHESTREGHLLPFDDLKKYRWIPCVGLLAAPIKARCRMLRKRYRGTADEDVRLLTYMDETAAHASGASVLPEELRSFSREVVSTIGIEPHYIELRDAGLHKKRTNINLYYGELLKSNFEYYCRRKIGLLPGEYRYLVGISQVLVKDSNYIDYANIHSQLRMLSKLERWEKIIKGQVSRIKQKPGSDSWRNA